MLLQAPQTTFSYLLLQALTHVSWLGLLLAFLAYFLLGGLWYTKLFPKAYGAAMGKASVIQESSAVDYIVGPGGGVLMITLANAVLLRVLFVESYAGALLFALVIGVGLVLPVTVINAINPNSPRPYLYSLITGGYHLVGILLGCLILVTLR